MVAHSGATAVRKGTGDRRQRQSHDKLPLTYAL